MLKFGSNFHNKNIQGFRALSTLIQRKNDASEYSEIPEYPPIVEKSPRLEKKLKNFQWYAKIQRIDTIEEKMIEINMPRYYGHKCLMLNDKVYPYSTLPFFQHATKTEFVNCESHVPTNEEETKKIDIFLSLIRSDIQEAFEFELDGYK